MAANVAVTYNFVAGTPSVADNVDQNFIDLVNWININAVHLDGSKAFTAVPSGPATDPSSANQLARKAYVDAVLPVGIIQAYAGSTAPGSNWLFCQGQAVSRSTYAGLFGVVGTTYGVGDGSTTFNLPNLQGRIPVGRDTGQVEFDVLGETGGAKTHTLTSGEMPSHTHVQDAHNHTQNSHNHTQDAHNHGLTDAGHAHADGFAGGDILVTDFSATLGQLDIFDGGSGLGYSTISTTAGATTGITVNNATATNQAATATNNAATATNQNTGGGGAHNNLQPYIVLNYLIKVL